jgi:hypothetical protein
MDFLLSRATKMEITGEVVKAAAGNYRNGEEVMDVLLTRDAKAVAETLLDKGRTLLHWAAVRSHVSVVRRPLDQGVDIEAKDEDGQTAVYGDVECSDMSVLRLLLEAGADVEVIGTSGWTPLQWATVFGHKEAMQLLLEKRPNINTRGQLGLAALQMAKMHGHDKVVQLLEVGSHTESGGSDGEHSNSATSYPSSYVNYFCDRSQFPYKTVMELRDHHDEIWYVQFSHDGTRLASASRDSSVIVYSTETFEVIHQLSEHSGWVSFIAWSPDDSKLLSCSHDKKAKLWDTHVSFWLSSLWLN